jgi:hypothetical protein
MCYMHVLYFTVKHYYLEYVFKSNAIFIDEM